MGVVAVLVMIFICGGTLSADHPPLPKGCRVNGKMYTKGQHFISRHGASGTCSNCVCQGQDRVGCLLMCAESRCRYGHDGFRKVERARGCYCKVPRCLPKPTLPPLPTLPTGCHHKGKIYHKGQPFISRVGSSGNSCGSCVCKGYGRVSCVPLCPVSFCPFGNAGFRKIRPAPGCYCKVPRCVLPTRPPLKTIKPPMPPKKYY